MSTYKVEHKENPSFTVEASDYSDAMEIVLDREGYKVSLQKEIDYSIYYQRGSRNKGIYLDSARTLSFQTYGCFVHCLAFMAKKDPIEVLELLKKNGGITSTGLVLSQRAAEILGLDLLKGNSAIPGKMTDINYMPKFTSIKEVSLGKSQHFVVRLIGENGERSIFDPWTGKILTINYYPFRSYRLFKNK